MQLLQKVSEPTKEIMIARHSGIMFKEMDYEKLLLAAKKLLADLNLLTGIKLPEDEALSQLSIFTAESLKEDYSHFTVPLMLQAFKKHSSVLTTGKEKSYGRTLSLTDVHQVMDAYSLELVSANEEIDTLMQKDTVELKLSEIEKQNLIREGIQQQLNSGNFCCTYADFNQLRKDGLLTENALTKQGWNGLQNLKKKYSALANIAIYGNNYREKLSLLIELEEEIKGEVAELYLKHCKESNKKLYE